MLPSPTIAELTRLLPPISGEQLPELPPLVALTAVLAQYGPPAFGENATASRVANRVTPASIHNVTPEGRINGPLMNEFPGPLLLMVRRTANFVARYCDLASSSPEAPATFTLGIAAAIWALVASVSAFAIAAPTSASTLAPQASSAAWMRAWSGLTTAGSAAT